MDPSKLEKLSKLLDRTEQESKKLLDNEEITSKRSLQENIQKGLELYTIISTEFANYCYLNGTDKERSVVIRISRGYNTLLNQMLKLLIAQFTKVSDHLTTLPGKSLNIIASNQDGLLPQTSQNSLKINDASPTMPQKLGQKRNTRFPLAVSVTTDPAKNTSKVEHLEPNGTTLTIPTQNNSPLNLLRRGSNTGAELLIPRLNPFVERDEAGSRSLNGSQLPSLVQLDPEEQKQEEERVENNKAIEELLKRKEFVDKITATTSGQHLRQVLRNLARSKKQGDKFLENESDYEERDADFNEIQDHLFRAYDGAQRKTAIKVLKYADRRSEKGETIKNVWKNSVGTEPDYAMLEAERKALVSAKDEEYQKLVYTVENENKNLKERVEDLQKRLAESVGEFLEFKVKAASDEVSRNMLEKQLRELTQNNFTFKEKIDRKKLTIKELREDLVLNDGQTRGIGDQIEVLVARNKYKRFFSFDLS